MFLINKKIHRVLLAVKKQLWFFMRLEAPYFWANQLIAL